MRRGTVYFGKVRQWPIAEYVYIGDTGERIDYGRIPKGERLQKFYDAIEAVRTGKHPVCTVQCAIPHLEAVEKIAKLPIVSIPAEGVEDIREDDDTFHTICRAARYFYHLLQKPGNAFPRRITRE